MNQQSREAMKVSALHSSAAALRPDIAALLLAKGANPNLRAEAGVTVFHEVAITGQIELAEMLLTYGADLNAKDTSGKTPLAHAIDSKKEAMATWLRAHGEVTRSEISVTPLLRVDQHPPLAQIERRDHLTIADGNVVPTSVGGVHARCCRTLAFAST